MISTWFKHLSGLSLCLALAGVPALAAPPVLVDDDDKDEDKQEKKGDDAEEEEDEDADKWFAVVGGDVYTAGGSFMRGATILSKNGVIEEIGYDLFLPEEAETLDARGLRVYPGLVALSATSRISRGLFAADTEELEDEDANDEADFDPHYGLDDLQPGDSFDGGVSTWRPDESVYDTNSTATADKVNDQAESYDPFSQYLVLALATGITSAEQSGTALKLKRREIDGVFMNEKAMIPISWSNSSSIRATREKFEKAAQYLRDLRAWQEDSSKDKGKEPPRQGVDSNVLKILSGEVLARFQSNDRSDLLKLARLAQQYRFRPVVVGCREGWTVASELGRAGAYAIVTPRSRVSKDERLVRPGGSSIENAAILHRHGVQVAVIPGNTSFELSGITGRDLMHLPIEAGFAIRGGLPEAAALDAITTVPARLLGIDHRVGSIEVGKDCDVVVTDGDILHYQTFVQYAVVAGKLAYDKEEEIFFAHIRPRPEKPALDPGEEPAEDDAEPAGDEDAEGDDDEGDEGEDEGAEEGGEGEEEDSSGDDE